MDEIQAASKQEHGCRCMYENRSIKNQKGTIIAVKLKIAKRAVSSPKKFREKNKGVKKCQVRNSDQHQHPGDGGSGHRHRVVVFDVESSLLRLVLSDVLSK